MKYMLFVCDANHVYTEGERERCIADSIQLCHELHKQGKYLGAAPLQPAAMTTSVRVREGKRIITDGPFAETVEQLGGYFLVDVADLDEAIQIAARIPGARHGTIEIRPLHELTGLPAKQ